MSIGWASQVSFEELKEKVIPLCLRININLLLVFLLVLSQASHVVAFSAGKTTQAKGFELQLLHASDMEGGNGDIRNAPNFVAVVEKLERLHENSLFIMSGDLVKPGPYFSASAKEEMQQVIQRSVENIHGLDAGVLTGIQAGSGRADFLLANIVGVDAMTLGNHEFDKGPGLLSSMVGWQAGEVASLASIEWLGAGFPLLSANIDMSDEPSLGKLATQDIVDSAYVSAKPDQALFGGQPSTIAPAVVLRVGGEKIGIIGATSQRLKTISSPGDIRMLGGEENNMEHLASVLQPIIDRLASMGINKIVLASHLQQLSLERQLAQLLYGIDIIVAGGSNSLLANPRDVSRGLFTDGSGIYAPYPIVTKDAGGNDVVIVNTDGGWRYVGNLVVEFDPAGKVVVDSLEALGSGVYSATDSTVERLWRDIDLAFAEGTKGRAALELVTALEDVVAKQSANSVAITEVFLNGERQAVRQEETNLGRLTADADLWYARQCDSDVVVSVKNAGSITDSIATLPGVTGLTEARPSKADLNIVSRHGAPMAFGHRVTEHEIASSLQFNNALEIVSVSRKNLVVALENALNSSYSGSFPQVGGVRFSFIKNVDNNYRISQAFIVNEAGKVVDILVEDDAFKGHAKTPVSIVTTGFLANGGDDVFSQIPLLDRSRVLECHPDGGRFDFANPGSEQDAFAEYLGKTFDGRAINIVDTPAHKDCRIWQKSLQVHNAIPSSEAANKGGNDSADFVERCVDK